MNAKAGLILSSSRPLFFGSAKSKDKGFVQRMSHPGGGSAKSKDKGFVQRMSHPGGVNVQFLQS
jgi:ribosomal protein L34